MKGENKNYIIAALVMVLGVMSIVSITRYIPDLSLVDNGTRLLIFPLLIALALGPVFYSMLKKWNYSKLDSFRYGGLCSIFTGAVLIGLTLFLNFEMTRDCQNQAYRVERIETFFASAYGRLEDERLANRWQVTFKSNEGLRTIVFDENVSNYMQGEVIYLTECTSFFGQTITKINKGNAD